MCFPSFKKKIFIEVNFQSTSCTKNIDVEYTGKSLKKKNPDNWGVEARISLKIVLTGSI